MRTRCCLYLLPMLSALIASGCTGDGSPPENTEPVAAVTSRRSVSLGHLDHEKIRNLIYAGMSEKLARHFAAADQGNPAPEITLGEQEAFGFTVMKLMRGKDDVSDDPAAEPDGIEVEVSGWLKKTPPNAAPECLGFDMTATVILENGQWIWPAHDKLTLGRQDAEDCY